LAEASWVPDACTLPTADRPTRLTEFDDLFATAVRSADRTDPGRLRLELLASPEVAARAANLAVRETGCCSFFTFTLCCGRSSRLRGHPGLPVAVARALTADPMRRPHRRDPAGRRRPAGGRPDTVRP
jgi:hypothetical protein